MKKKIYVLKWLEIVFFLYIFDTRGGGAGESKYRFLGLNRVQFFLFF